MSLVTQYVAKGVMMPRDFYTRIVRDNTGGPQALAFGVSNEGVVACQIRALKLPVPEREFRFMPPRRFRFDFAWSEQKVALEVEGGEWIGGRHTRGAGYTNDCIKYSEAAIRGWKVIRVTGKMIKDGSAIELLKRALNGGE
jgi:hypothetical protein